MIALGRRWARSWSFIPVVLWFLVGAAPPVTAAQGHAPAADARLAAVKVKGNQRYSLADVSLLSGLAIGKPATLADLTAAANRLAATGLFNTVKYTYNIAAGSMTVTFEIEEAAWTVPVTFDDFVWMTDADLTAAVRQEVPSFDGTAPLNAGAGDFIATALQR